MKKTVAMVLLVTMMVQLFAVMATPEQMEAAKKQGKTPRISGFSKNWKPVVVIGIGGKKILSTVNVGKNTKVKFKQSKKSKKVAVVKWKKKKKCFQVTGKDFGETTVTIRFIKKKKTTKFKLTIRVWECRLPHPTSNCDLPSYIPEPTGGTPSASAGASEVPPPSQMPTETPYNPSAAKNIYKDYFLVGAAINGSSRETAAINHQGMSDILKVHFNSTTLSNLMKPEHLLDEAATKASADGMPVCKFDTCDPALQFCQENGIKMRGHTLVWHNQTPEWFFYEDYDTTKNLVDAATMEQRMDSYFRQVLTHCQEKYPGVIYCWDVVNECVCTDANSYVVTSGGWKLRGSTIKDNDFTHETAVVNYWYATMGETYVEKAFACARKYAAPDVKLFYNDYNVFQTDKMNNIYKMAEELKSKGLIDGIGLQPTVLLDWPELNSDKAGSFKVCLEKYAELGLELQVTELSFQIKGVVNEERLQMQADRYREFMELLLEEDSDNGGPCNITSVTVFGICDDYPLYDNFSQNLYLWDKNCQPKPCFYSFIEPGQKKQEEQTEQTESAA